MLSSASKRTDRAAAATGALLLQLGFIAAFVHAFSAQSPPRPLQHELIFILPPLPRVKPPEQTGAAPRQVARPANITPPLATAPPTASAPSSTDLQNFGQALSGCAPETYSSLTPEQKAHCPRPGEGMAIQEAPNLMGTPSHVKEESRWANALAHKKSPLLMPGASQDRLGLKLVGVDDSGKVSGLAGGAGDAENWPAYDVKTYAAGDFYKQEQATEAWNRAHMPTTKSAVAHPQ